MHKIFFLTDQSLLIYQEIKNVFSSPHVVTGIGHDPHLCIQGRQVLAHVHQDTRTHSCRHCSCSCLHGTGLCCPHTHLCLKWDTKERMKFIENIFKPALKTSVFSCFSLLFYLMLLLEWYRRLNNE